MPGELTVRAGWALWSKPAGTRQDYSVVACSSEPFSRADFGAIITRFAVGTPDAMATGPDALPWIAVSWVGVDDGLHLGIAITDKTGQADGVGRPITQTAYYCVPYAPLAEAARKYQAPVSYAALCEAVARHPVGPRDGRPITVALEPMSADRASDAVRRHGGQVVAGTAALLLAGPVSVVGADGSTTRERLDFIDAVASLLPYGYRAKFSAATWSQSGTKLRMRLAFGAYPREDATTVVWRRGAEPGDTFGVARRYLDQLRRLTDGDGSGRSGRASAARTLSESDVVAHLAADIQPRRFEQPQDAIASLDRLDLPFRVLRTVLDGTGADLDELRQVVRLDWIKEFMAETDIAALLSELAARGEAGDWPDLRRGLTGVRDAEDRARILVAFGRRLLWSAWPEVDAVRDCLRFAAQSGFADSALAGLVLRPDSPGGQRDGLAAAADLLCETVLAGGLADGAAGGGPGPDYPRTRELLAGRPVAVTEYAAAVPGAGRAGALLRWADPEGTSPYRGPFEAALGVSEGQVAPADVADLAALGIECVGALLQVASHARRLEAVLPACTRWLAQRGQLDQEEPRYWAARLGRLDAPSPQLRAWLDTALLMVGGEPTGLPPAGERESQAYGDNMGAIWKGLGNASSLFSPEGCAQALAGYLDRQPWARSAEQAYAVTRLATQLSPCDRQGSLALTVASTLAATPAARQWEFAQNWLAWARENDPAAVRDRLLDALADPSSAEPGYLAELCVRACRDGIEPAAALRQLAKSGALTSAAQASQLVMGVQQGLDEAGVDEDTVVKWQFGFYRLLARGEFGPQLGQELRELVFDRTRREIWRQLRLLAIFAANGKDRQYEWTEPEREGLALIADEIDSMLKKSRKSQLTKLLDRLVGGANGADDAAPGEDGRPVAEASAGGE